MIIIMMIIIIWWQRVWMPLVFPLLLGRYRVYMRLQSRTTGSK